MNSKIETVKVKHDDGYMIINKDDFNPEIHELYDEQDLQKLNREEFDTKSNEQLQEQEQQPAPVQEEKKPVQRKRAASKNEDNSRK